MRDGGPIDQQIRELFDVLPTLFHVDGYVDVGDGGSLVTQCHLRFGSADPQALQERRTGLAQRRSPFQCL